MASPGYGLQLVQAPTWSPVTLGMLSKYGRVLGNDDATNGVLQSFLSSAQSFVETQTDRKFGLQQWVMTMDEFPGRQVDDYRPPTWRYGIFRMPFSPLISVDLVEYVDPMVDTSGPPYTYTTLPTTEYMWDINTEPGRLAPAPYKVWPATNPLTFQAVKVTFTCGHTAANMPPGLVTAIEMMAIHLYDHRHLAHKDALACIPYGLRALIQSDSDGEYN